MIEPFVDFNPTPDHRWRLRRLGLFREPISSLARYGLKPHTVFSDLPTKLHYGVGLVICDTTRALRGVK